jgi:HK97 family phage major capsid protein/HK97 family phage prohead protease
VDVTEEFIWISIRDAATFVQDSFRQVTLSEEQGIHSRMGKLKSDPNGPMVIQAYYFDRSKFTVAQAEAWVKDHKECFPMTINRAYSVLTIKSLDEDRRIIEGIATTPTPDRVGDVIVPEGMEFKLPLPLLYQHNSSKPIGNVVAARADASGVTVTARLAPAGTADFIDEAWALIKAGLVRGLSVGFRSLEETYDKVNSGYKFIRTELMELSAVTIPANAEATILSVKSADSALAALGREGHEPVRLDTTKTLPGASGHDTTGKTMKTLAEQIASFEAKRAADVARKEEIISKASEEGRTLDDAEKQEFDGLEGQVKEVDEHLVRLRAHEKEMVVKAVPAEGKTQQAASQSRGGVITVKGPDLPKGTAFVRYAMALATTKGDRAEAYEIAKNNQVWRDQTPQVERVLANADLHRNIKLAVAAGTTTAAHWAAELADYTYMASEFIEYLRPMTIIGRVQGFRRVPFNVRLPLQDAGSSAQWVGEGLVKPLSKLNFDTITFRFAKAAGIVVLTDELVRFSNPSAEALVRQDLANAVAQFLDQQFINPAVFAVPNVSPAAITNAATTTAATGTTAANFRTDFALIMVVMVNANIPPSGSVWVMRPTQAVALQMMTNVIGQPEFPDINADGGTLLGYQVIPSNSSPAAQVTFFKPGEILLADDGGITLDASREASITMDDGGSPATATVVSMWQHNMVALRAERYINWARRRFQAVYYLTACNYHQ